MKKSTPAKQVRRCAACGKAETENTVDAKGKLLREKGRPASLRTDHEENLVCHACPLVLDDD